MSKSRHPPSLVRSYSITHPPGQVRLPTERGWDQLVFAQTGLFTAHTNSHAWTIPAHRALCVPDGSQLQIETAKRAAIRCLYSRVELDLLGDSVRVVNLDPLTHQLTTHAINSAPMTLDDPANAALMVLLADQLAKLPDTPLQLPFPTDPTAKQLARAIMLKPQSSLTVHLNNTAASRRTLERLFKSQTRMSLGQWRRRACILSAVSMLADGESVTNVGLATGYASSSSFIAAFRSEMGASPREFMRVTSTTSRNKPSVS